MLKILVVGDSNCGKTCFINRYVYNKYDLNTNSTIACEYSLKLFQVNDDITLRLNIWDIAGADSVGGVSKLFCRQAAGAVILCDLTDQDTLENAVRWKEELEKHVVSLFHFIMSYQNVY